MARLWAFLRESVGRDWRWALHTVVWALLVAPPTAAQADCTGEWQARRLEDVPDSSAEAGALTAIDVDIAGNARIASVARGELWFTIVGTGSEATFRFEGAGLISSAVIDTNERGVSSIAFSQRPGDDLDAGREVFLVQTLGGSFTTPRNISSSPGDDHDPRLALDHRGEAHVTWAQSTAETSQVLYWNGDLDAPSVAVARGEFPAIFVDQDDVVHIVCLQGSDIVYVNNATGSFTGRERATQSASIPESSVSIGALPDGTVLIAYESEGSLYLKSREPSGEYLSPRLVAEGGVRDPSLRVRPDGKVLLVYVRDGTLSLVLGQGSELGEPQLALGTDEVEGSAALDIDDSGNLHASFVRGSAVNYATNACAPVADFSADPTTGRDPVMVQFTDQSTGVIGRWEWDFGDGGTSGLRNPAHVYKEEGSYTVGLTVWGAGGLPGRKVIENLIVVDEPLYLFRIPDQHALPGAKGLWFPVLATSAEASEGFQIVGTFDPAFLTLVRSDLASTVLSANQIQPEFIETRIHETFFEIGAVFDFVPPFEGVDLPPVENQRLIHLVFDVADSAPPGETTRVELVNDRELTQIRNMIAVDGQARIPALKSSEVTIRPIEPPFPRLFVRGDFDSNGQVNLTDAVAALSFLFQSGSPPVCPDAGDFNDSGRIAITSIVALLNFLFTAGPAPAVPFPNAGLDPTSDDLGECLSSG